MLIMKASPSINYERLQKAPFRANSELEESSDEEDEDTDGPADQVQDMGL